MDLQEAQHRRDIKRQRRRFYMTREGRHVPSTDASDFVGRGEHNSASFPGHDLLSEDGHVHPATDHGEDHAEGGTDELEANIAFTPTVLTDWDGDADPGGIDDALNQLAERIDDTEALEHVEDHDHDGAPTQTLLAANTHGSPSASTHHTKYTDAEAIAAVEGEATLALSGAVVVTGDTELSLLNFTDPTDLTLDTNGLVTATQTLHRIDTFSSAANDDCTDIVGGSDGDILILQLVIGTRNVTLKHNAAAGGAEQRIMLAGATDLALDLAADTVTLKHHGGFGWHEISRSLAAVVGISKIFQFPAHDEDLAVGVMGARPGTNTGESGEHGAYTAVRATAFAGTVGSGAGATTILIEADDNPAFSSATTLFTLTLTAATEVVDTVLDNTWAAGDIFVRARCTAIEAVAPKDVNVQLMVKEKVY